MMVEVISGPILYKSKKAVQNSFTNSFKPLVIINKPFVNIAGWYLSNATYKKHASVWKYWIALQLQTYFQNLPNQLRNLFDEQGHIDI